MAPVSSRRTTFLICCIIAIIVVIFLWSPSPLSQTSDEPEPASLSVVEFAQLESGCRDNVSTSLMSRAGGDGFETVTFIETGTTSPNLSARTERTSPTGADLRTFRVYIDSHGEPQENTSCTLGAQYRIKLDYDRGETETKGTRVLWLENGSYSGCDAITSGSLESECYRFTREQQPDHVWANATATE